MKINYEFRNLQDTCKVKTAGKFSEMCKQHANISKRFDFPENKIDMIFTDIHNFHKLCAV